MKERILAVIMIDQACEERFGDFKKSRNEDAHLGRNYFLATKVRAAIALNNHCNVALKPKPNIGDSAREDMTVQFPAKDGSECIEGKDGRICPNVQCHRCKKYGHFKSQCPKKKSKSKKKDEDEKTETPRGEGE